MRPSSCYKTIPKNHIECIKFSEIWKDKTKPLPNFNFYSIFNLISNHCILQRKEVSDFLVEYAKVDKINIAILDFTKFISLNDTDILKIFENQANDMKNEIGIPLVKKEFKYFQRERPFIVKTIFESQPINEVFQFMMSKNDVNFNHDTKLIIATILNKNAKAISKLINTTNLKNFIALCGGNEQLMFNCAKEILQRTTTNISTVLGINSLEGSVPSKQIDKDMELFTDFVISSRRASYYSFVASFMAGMSLDPQVLLYHIDKQLDRRYFEHYNDIINILILNGLPVTKELALRLIQKEVSINNFEKYGVPVDEQIMEAEYERGFVTYVPSNKPSEKLLLNMCENQRYSSTRNVTVVFDNFKMNGAEFTTTLLQQACVFQSAPLLTYFIQKCGMKMNDECLTKYVNDKTNLEKETIINVIKNHYLTKYSTTQPVKKTVTIHEDLLTTIEKSAMDIVENKPYVVNKKIMVLLGIVDANMLFKTLKIKLLEYLKTNKYVIGSYFIVSGELAKILKIKAGTICYSDELENIASHLIK